MNITYQINLDKVGSVQQLIHLVDIRYRVSTKSDCAVFSDGKDKIIISPMGQVIHEDNNGDSAMVCYLNHWYNQGYIQLI